MVIIGLSTNWDNNMGADSMPRDYVTAVLNAGALPVILPMIPENHPRYEELMDKALLMVDGLVMTGGPDVAPEHYNEERLPKCGDIFEARDKADLTLIKKALAAKKPLLGICRGLQAVNVALGGSLYQDLDSQIETNIDHQRKDKGYAHEVTITEGTLLHRVVGKDNIKVTSRHHQATKKAAPGLMVSARSGDGVIEALEFENGYPGLLVQWHPENLAAIDDKSQQALFDWLVKAASRQ